MSHELDTKADGTAAMAWAGNETSDKPWHGLGTYVGESDVDSKTMLVAAGLDWSVSKQIIATSSGIELENKRAIVRDDRNEILGIVGPNYELFQNVECFDFMDELLGDQCRYHTAGSLKEGRIVWALVKLSGDTAVKRLDGTDDILEKYLMISAGHDGHTPIVISPTSIRAVCWNTLSAALDETEQSQFRIWHTTSAADRVSEARDAMSASIAYFDAMQTVAQELASTKMRMQDFRIFADKVILDADSAIGKVKDSLGKRAAKNHDARRETLETLFVSGKGNTGETKWDALNSVTEFIDHQRERLNKAKDTTEASDRAWRLDDAWFGNGAKVKNRALRLLTK